MNFEITQIVATDIQDAWFQCIYRLLDSGREYVIDRGSFEGQKRLEFDIQARKSAPNYNRSYRRGHGPMMGYGPRGGGYCGW